MAHDIDPAAEKTSLTTKLVALPVVVLAVFIGYIAWTAAPSWSARLGFALAFIAMGYWLYTPKGPRHIITRQVLSLLIIWGILVLFFFCWAVMEARPELFDGYDPERDSEAQLYLRLGWGAWILIYSSVAFLATRRLYRTLARSFQLYGLFSRYVAPSVIAEMLKSRTNFFETRKVELSVLFVDLRGFTATSARLGAEQVKELINLFMGTMIPVAHSWRGTVDKTVGDEIMVLFGAPLPYGDHADQAVKTALALLRAHADVSAQWHQRGLPVLEMGIGINTGEMVVGNIGCRERVDYTVLGHHVNLAARLCGKATGAQILVSEFTRSRLSEPLKQRVPPRNHLELEVKGIEGTVKAFAVDVTLGSMT